MFTRRLVHPLVWIALPLLACGEDQAVSASDTDTGGIDSIGSDSSSTTEQPTTDPMNESGSGESESGGDGSCLDGYHNSEETDVDCGGPDCEPCVPGQHCMVPSDCTTEVCENGECQAATCYDGVQNGNENGIDCGGGCPNLCNQSQGCENDLDCGDAEFCNDAGVCEASDCDNGIQDTHETDVDCGGADCPDCGPGGACLQDEDCTSEICDPDAMTCSAAACDDGVQNGDETDQDCGGSCPPCPNGADCMTGSDCASMSCDVDTCVAASCDDGIHNGQETDTDCGGPVCDPCDDMGECDDGDDCASGVCDTGMCVAPTCDDGVENGDETDVDCGNSCGQTCEVGERCDDGGDCIEEVCEFTVCSEPDCFDGVHNGDETDIDCGGPECAPCDPDQGCAMDSDCAEGVCDEMTGACLDPVCDDGVKNGDETDVDCGGPDCGACDVDEECEVPADCVEGVCELGVCEDAACDDDVQNGDEGGVDCQGSCPQPCDLGGEIDVNTFTNDFQTQPAVAVAPDGSFWVVVWTSTPTAGVAQDGDQAGVFGQMYDAMGPLGGEFQVNTTTAGPQQFPDVAAYDDGFVVTWQSGADQDGEGTGVYAQRYDAMGGELGLETLINQTTDGAQRRPSVAMDGSGNYVVCWDGQEQTFEVYCRRYATNGNALAGEVQVNVTENGDEQLPVVARDSAGNYTVVWQSSAGGDGDGIGVYMRRFLANGMQATAETIVNSFTAGDQNEPTLAMAADGDFVVVWTSEDQDMSGSAVVARRYSSAGAALGAAFIVNTTTAGSQQRPAAAMNGSDAFWIAWQTPNDGNTTGIFGQRYDNTGTPLGVEFIVNPTIPGQQQDPDAAIRNTDELVGVWSEGDGGFTDSEIRMIRYDGQL